ncbi:hypothetical protein MRX96_017258 [Rhipicephalus microplus]
MVHYSARPGFFVKSVPVFQKTCTPKHSDRSLWTRQAHFCGSASVQAHKLRNPKPLVPILSRPRMGLAFKWEIPRTASLFASVLRPWTRKRTAKSAKLSKHLRRNAFLNAVFWMGFEIG